MNSCRSPTSRSSRRTRSLIAVEDLAHVVVALVAGTAEIRAVLEDTAGGGPFRHQAGDELVGVVVPRHLGAVVHDVDHQPPDRIGELVQPVDRQAGGHEALKHLVVVQRPDHRVVWDQIFADEPVGHRANPPARMTVRPLTFAVVPVGGDLLTDSVGVRGDALRLAGESLLCLGPDEGRQGDAPDSRQLRAYVGDDLHEAAAVGLIQRIGDGVHHRRQRGSYCAADRHDLQYLCAQPIRQARVSVRYLSSIPTVSSLDRAHYQLLLALDRRGTISAAATELFITQSAASQRLREAERRLGFPLTTRQGRTVALTPAAQTPGRSGSCERARPRGRRGRRSMDRQRT